MVCEYPSGPLANPPPDDCWVACCLCCVVPRKTARVHLRDRRIRTRKPPGHAHFPGPLSDGDDLYLGGCAGRCNTHGSTQSGCTSGLFPLDCALHGSRRTPGEPQGFGTPQVDPRRRETLTLQGAPLHSREVNSAACWLFGYGPV